MVAYRRHRPGGSADLAKAVAHQHRRSTPDPAADSRGVHLLRWRMVSEQLLWAVKTPTGRRAVADSAEVAQPGEGATAEQPAAEAVAADRRDEGAPAERRAAGTRSKQRPAKRAAAEGPARTGRSFRGVKTLFALGTEAALRRSLPQPRRPDCIARLAGSVDLGRRWPRPARSKRSPPPLRRPAFPLITKQRERRVRRAPPIHGSRAERRATRSPRSRFAARSRLPS